MFWLQHRVAWYIVQVCITSQVRSGKKKSYEKQIRGAENKLYIKF